MHQNRVRIKAPVFSMSLTSREVRIRKGYPRKLLMLMSFKVPE